MTIFCIFFVEIYEPTAKT